MSEDTATFLLLLLNQVTLQASSPSFDSDVAQVQRARAELLTIINPDTPTLPELRPEEDHR